VAGFYIGSYASEEAEGVLYCHLDPASGELRVEGGMSGVENPSFLALNRQRTRLYCVSEGESFQGSPYGGVAACGLEGESSIPRMLNTMPSMGTAPCHISLSADERYLFAANYSSGNVAVYPVQEDGSLEPVSDIQQHQGSSLNPERQEGPHAHMIQPTEDGCYVVTADLGLDQLLVYGFDVQAGTLNPLPEKTLQIAPGEGPRHFIFHPAHPRLYLINELGNTLMTFAVDLPSCSIKGPLQTISTLPDGFQDTSFTADLHLHPNGKFLYGSNRGHNSLVCCRVDPEDQMLTVKSHTSSGGDFPRNFAIAPSGRFLIVANQDSSSLQSFSLNPDTGALAPLHSLTLEVKPVCILFA